MSISPTPGLEPRVSVLEKGQEALQKDLISLTSSVKDQGLQLTAAIAKLSDTVHERTSILSEKMSNQQKTDWQTLFTAAGVVLLIISAVLTPIWMKFTDNEKMHDSHDRDISTLVERVQEVQLELVRLKYDRPNQNSL